MLFKRLFWSLVVTIFAGGLLSSCGKKDEPSPVGTWKDRLGSTSATDGTRNFETLTLFQITPDTVTITKKCFTSTTTATASVVIKTSLDLQNRSINFLEEKQDSASLNLDGASIPCTVYSPPSGVSSYEIIGDQFSLTLSTGASRPLQRYQN